MGCNTSNATASTKTTQNDDIVSPEILAQEAHVQKPDLDKLEAAFYEVDTDRSGFVDKKELKKMFASSGNNFSDSFVDAVITIVDDNNNDRIEKKEFYQIVYILQNLGTSAPKERIMFLNADKDFSGTIQLKEFEYILEHIGENKSNAKPWFGKMLKQGESAVRYSVFCHAIERILKK